MAQFPALPLWTDAYIADTTDLSAEEHGVYLLLLMAAWRSPDCALPDDDLRLSRMARVGSKKWQKMRPVMLRFFTVSDNGWTQKRLLKEHDRVSKSYSQKVEAGRSSALKRKETPPTDVATDEQRTFQQPEPEPEPYNPPVPTVQSPQGGKSSKRKRTTRLPNDWQPNEAQRAYAAKKGMNEDEISSERDEIVDWSAASPNGAKLDWNAAWQTWCRRYVKERDNGPKRSGGNHRKPNSVIAAANRSLSANGPEHGGSGNPVANVWGAKPRGPGGSPGGLAGRNGGASDAPRIADGTVGTSGGDGIAGHDRGRHDVCERVDGAGVGGVSSRRGAVGNSVDGKTIDILPGTVGTCGSLQSENGQAREDSHVPESGFAKDGSGDGE